MAVVRAVWCQVAGVQSAEFEVDLLAVVTQAAGEGRLGGDPKWQSGRGVECPGPYLGAGLVAAEVVGEADLEGFDILAVDGRRLAGGEYLDLARAVGDRVICIRGARAGPGAGVALGHAVPHESERCVTHVGAERLDVGAGALRAVQLSRPSRAKVVESVGQNVQARQWWLLKSAR